MANLFLHPGVGGSSIRMEKYATSGWRRFPHPGGGRLNPIDYQTNNIR